MKKLIVICRVLVGIVLSGCSPAIDVISTPPPSSMPSPVFETPMPTAVSTIETTPSSETKQYSNSAFGLSFQYPANWYGPDEYVSGQTLRVAVGSDVVYPYGEPPEEPSAVKNSYLVVLQYSRGEPAQAATDTIQTLLSLKDGESVSGARGKIIRIRQLDFGTLTGFEYIATLSDTAQTEPVYNREVILTNNLSSAFAVLTISGSPNNVEIEPGTSWQVEYQAVDRANVEIFHDIVESVTIKN